MKILNIFGKFIYYLLIVFLMGIAGIIALSAFNIPGGIKMYTVMSGSMEPSIPVGGLVVTRQSTEYIVGDVITFEDIENPKFNITHRIVEVRDADSNPKYYTKGDANNSRDSDEVTKPRISGKVIATIPYIGYPVSFAKTQNGFIVLIVIPTTILIYGELMNIKKEITKLVENRNKKKQNKESIYEETNE